MSNDSTLFCDNYATCNSAVFDRGSRELTLDTARARGWHIWSGTDHGGRWSQHYLCAKCVGTSRSRLPKALPVLEGQLELFEGKPRGRRNDQT